MSRPLLLIYTTDMDFQYEVMGAGCLTLIFWAMVALFSLAVTCTGIAAVTYVVVLVLQATGVLPAQTMEILTQ